MSREINFRGKTVETMEILEAENKRLQRKIDRIRRLRKRYINYSNSLFTMEYAAKDIEQALKGKK